jgi:hypothetical protein
MLIKLPLALNNYKIDSITHHKKRNKQNIITNKCMYQETTPLIMP